MTPSPAADRSRGPGLLRNLWHSLGLLFWVILFRLLNRTRIEGRRHIPRRYDKGVLVLANHVSAIDPFLIAATAMPFFSPVWWRAPAKAELFELPIVRNILSSWGAIPVRRGQRDIESIQRMAALLPHGVIVAFPEGRRSTDGRLLPGRPGLGKVIYDARPQKVVPVYIQDAHLLLPKGSVLPRLFRSVTIRYGPPVDLSRFLDREGSAAVSQQIIDEVMRAIDALKSSVNP